MKKCIQCYQEKPLTEFYRNKHNADGHNNHCGECQKARFKKYYYKNKPRHLQLVKAYKARIQAQINEYKKVHPCITCGESDECCIDFHHLDPSQKDFSLGEIAQRSPSWARVQREILKCAALCANCHRKLHAGKLCLIAQRDYYINKDAALGVVSQSRISA